jgi:hypothetical protein
MSLLHVIKDGLGDVYELENRLLLAISDEAVQFDLKVGILQILVIIIFVLKEEHSVA